MIDINWKGRYRGFVDAMTAFCNNYAVNWQKDLYTAGGVKVSTAEMQILAHILENDSRHMKMTEISNSIGIAKSTFSRYVSELESKYFVVKLHPEDNKKDIIIQTTELGKEAYLEYSLYIFENVFKPVFNMLDALPEDSIIKLTEALHVWVEEATQDAG